MKKVCENCGRELLLAGTGRPKRFCGQTCRKAWSRKPKFPAAMVDRESWVRADGKRPIQPDGIPASSTDPGTWSSFAAVQSGVGDGFGVMLGDGLGCYDLDSVTDEQARAFIATVREPVLFVERSMSGNGVHVFIEAAEGIGWKRTINGISVERYSRARFIRVTGKEFK